MELIIPLHHNSPIYEQIYSHIKGEIQRKNILAGEKLPSTRALSLSLKVSRSTVQSAYDQLEAEGYISPRPGSGYYSNLFEGEAPEPLAAPLETVLEKKKEKEAAIDFSPWGVDLEDFPFALWRRLYKQTLDKSNPSMFVNGDGRGEPALRRALVQYLYRARGVRATKEQVIIGAGSEYLLMLLGLLLEKGRIAFEEPTYVKAVKVFGSMGWKRCTFRGLEEGMGAEILGKNAVDLAYVMPANQYPTGRVMPVKGRLALLAWARREQCYILEDDYDSEYRFKGKPIPSLQGMDPCNRVIYLGTFSRAIAPAIRVAYMVLPPSLMEGFQEKLSFLHCTVPRADQNVLYQFLVGGHFERHLNRMRKAYRDKRRYLLSLLGEYLPQIQIGDSAAGLHLILQLEHAEKIAQALKKQGVLAYPLSEFYVEQPKNDFGLLLGFARLSLEKMEKGVQILARVLES